MNLKETNTEYESEEVNDSEINLYVHESELKIAWNQK